MIARRRRHSGDVQVVFLAPHMRDGAGNVWRVWRCCMPLVRSLLVLCLVLSAGVARGQDGGVWAYNRAVLELPDRSLVWLDAGVALDGPVAIDSANELQRLRSEPRTSSWVTTAAAVVASVVYAADQVRRWVRPGP